MVWQDTRQMIRLILCQVKQLLPFVWLWSALIFMFYGLELTSARIDELSYLDWCSDYCQVGSDANLVLFTIFLYMLAAYSLFPREFDEGTIDFVRSLPVSRGEIFLAKVLAAWLLICALITLEALFHSALLLFNTQTISGTKYWNNDFVFWLRNCLFALVIVSHGVFISWFRTIGLILYSAYLIGLMWLEQTQGVSGTYNLFRFFNNEYDGSRLLPDWPAIGIQVAIALVLLAISYVMWTRTDSRPRTPGAGRVSRMLPVLMSVAAFVLVAITLAGLVMRAAGDKTRGNIQKITSDHYQFAYKQADQSRMLELQQYADDDYIELVSLLGMQDTPFIHADMTSQSNHALGVATYNKIRMVLTAGESQRRLGTAANSVGFFIEGMAQYTSFKIVPDDPTRTTNWTISSVAWDRFNITFDELANRQLFEAQYDPELLYGIGDIWVDAMVEVCGEASLGDFLRSNARKDTPGNLFGVSYWRHHLNQIGCGLEQVNHAWREQMQSIVDNRSEGAFPTFSNVSTSINGSNLLVTATVTPDADEGLPNRYYIRVKGETKVANTISPIRIGRQTTVDGEARVEFTIPLIEIQGSRFRYQIGYVPYFDSRYFFEQWRSGALPR
jgi:hypothetical protein